MTVTIILAAIISFAVWLVLWLRPSSFWRTDREPVPSPPDRWPAVTAIIPARNEESVIAETIYSLLTQDYPSSLRIVVVDDHSDDRTAEVANEVGGQSGQKDQVSVLSAEPLPAGWTGKVWAMHQGLGFAARPTDTSDPTDPADSPEYLLFSDADISHGHSAVRELVSRAEAGPCDLVSFMVKLQCRSSAEKLMIPAFVFFFRMLYPFRGVNDPKHGLAGAAGGTMLVRRDALDRIGGIESIRGEIIDDCALAREVKRGGHRIWLGMSDSSRSTRSYGTLGEIMRMISRTAYTQLGYSPIRLLICIAGLAITFIAPPLLVIFTRGWSQILGGAAWLLMSALYLPMVRFYRQSPLWAPLLPLTASIYLWATIVSACRYHFGKSNEWKGRRGGGLVRPEGDDMSP